MDLLLLIARLTIPALAIFGRAPAPSSRAERVVANDNRAAAGRLVNGVLTVHLELREGEWHPDRDTDPSLIVRAVAEEGKPLSIPGPMIRVPEGTEIRATIRNSLPDSAVTLHGFSTRGSDDSGSDTLRVARGESREIRFIAGTAGTYYYWATTTPGDNILARGGKNSELSGAFIVDRRGAARASDRVLVLNFWRPAATAAPPGFDEPIRFTINGKTWPNTERLTYDVGDSVRFRLINASSQVHPMHLHGFYFRVDTKGNGNADSVFAPATPARRVVTERLAPGSTASITWTPDRPGYWLFHCHDNAHAMRSLPFDGSPLTPTHKLHVTNHAEEMMGGLVMGIEVRPRRGVILAAEPRERRALRLVAQVDPVGGGTEQNPSYGYVLEERGRPSQSASGPILPGPTIVVRRGEPVAITVVNRLTEATAVHWHGIELDSYYDGVPDFAGHPRRIAPAIAPGDSFVARFTPPRSGTFIYHPHADEVRQQQAGLSGALLVVDSLERYDPAHDLVLMISVPHRDADRDRVLVNGSLDPSALEMRVGEHYRLRVINIHTYRPSMVARLLRDSTVLSWRALAKDGMDLPSDQATTRPARVQMGNGETYDFEFTPETPGQLRLSVTAAVGNALASVPIIVR